MPTGTYVRSLSLDLPSCPTPSVPVWLVYPRDHTVLSRMSFWRRYNNFPVRLPIPAPRSTSAAETSIFLEDADAADATQNGHFKALEHRNLSS
ncbi:hypothetical protein CDEST_12577 [Colletotrichum destructivum]|uniref:Uncharacterized protein n=1 Tax=Colletotrichum destructivum TaxID=34406 RepID=A0AAX4IWN8_9PEZI|nr:hypothetical protein CDEST_12577 [Colletotrichum destructivum]